MRLCSFKSIPVVVGLASALFSWDTVYAANLCEGSTEYTVTEATGDSANSRHRPDRVIDGNTADWSRWSSKGKGLSIVLDLGETRDVDQIQTLWLLQSSRTSYFDVDTSKNGSSWTNVLSSAATDLSSSMLTFDLQGTAARYVKIIAQGNSSNSWNHLVEAKVFGCEDNTPTNNESIARIQSLFDLEGGDNDLNPVQGNTMVFDALAAQHVTPNGNGWRHEYKMATENRRAMSETSEDFSARIKFELSTGSKTIVAQYHGGDLGTLVKIYISDTNESGHNDSVANNGVFDVYARVTEEGSSSETILDFGTIRSGDSIDLALNNRTGQVYVSAMGIDDSYSVEDSDQAYLKFGNYLQAQEAVSGDKIDDSSDWADFYQDAGITKSKVTFSNINYYQY